jgi:hypothetical protein
MLLLLRVSNIFLRSNKFWISLKPVKLKDLMQKETGPISLTFIKQVTPEKLTEIGVKPIVTEDVNKGDILHRLRQGNT